MLEIMNKENSMSNNIFYGPYNEIRCDRFALEKLVKESEAKDQRISELEEQLKNAIRFKTPQVERFAVVQYIHWEKKPYKIVNCFDAYKDENMKTRYCFYGVPSTNFKVIEICDTKEEAEQKLAKIKGEKNE